MGFGYFDGKHHNLRDNCLYECRFFNLWSKNLNSLFLIFFQICAITGGINGIMLTTRKQRLESDEPKGITLLDLLPYDLRGS